MLELASQSSTQSIQIRAAQPPDTITLFSLVKALAEYENLSDVVEGTVEALHSHLFGNHPHAEAIVAEVDGEVVGFALFFTNYSTFLTQPGLYLEDLFVLPSHRRLGLGRRLLTHLAQLAIARNYGRFEWSVLDWNQPAINFYEKMGATVLPDWRICRVTGHALTQLASTPSAPSIDG
jgi:GNAT superfamily N-acetyltransferase